MQLVVDHIVASKNGVVFESPHRKGIKIAMKPGVAPVVSELDRNILTVKEALEVLQKVTAQIGKEMQGFHDRAKQALSQKRRDDALKLLQRKKLYESTLSTKTATLDQLQGILFKIQTAENASEVYQALKVAPHVLRSKNAEVNLDDLAELQSDIDDVMGDLREKNEALAQNAVLSSVEEQELEEELAALLAAPASPIPLQASGSLHPPQKVATKSEEQKEQEEAEEVDALMARLQAMRVPDAPAGREGAAKEKERVKLALPAG
jgi:hypothetical protein